MKASGYGHGAAGCAPCHATELVTVADSLVQHRIHATNLTARMTGTDNEEHTRSVQNNDQVAFNGPSKKLQKSDH